MNYVSFTPLDTQRLLDLGSMPMSIDDQPPRPTRAEERAMAREILLLRMLHKEAADLLDAQGKEWGRVSFAFGDDRKTICRNHGLAALAMRDRLRQKTQE